MAKISVVMPLYNGILYVQEALQSIQKQTFEDWEFIIVNEYGSEDGCAEVVREYAKADSRIRLIQNTIRLGLAESLNVGIEAAKGEYIARVDADDPSYPERFEKQVKFLDEHPEIALCGTLQRSVLPNRSYVEEVPYETEELKAALLFGCEISHCSVMFRHQVFVQNGWKYDGDRLGEDYDLWTKIMFDARLCNLPEVLVDHRWGFHNISLAKGEALHQEVREISARSLERFGIKVSKEDFILLSGWRNRPEESARKNIAGFLKKTYKLLDELVLRNYEIRLIRENALQKILWKRWNWACKTCGLFFRELPYEDVIHNEITPMVSVVLPVYESVHTLRETIDSILAQDYEEWELVIVCEHGNYDGSTELAKYYAKLDKRIRVIENDEQLGLAGSLNKGIELARAEYIARIDSDDLMNAKRLSTQLNYMEQNKDVGVTQFYQHYFGDSNFIHKPPVKAEELKAKLLFFCDVCHSTVMIRKSILDRYNIQYNADSVLEDYELWTRLLKVTKFATIPEIYGEYRVGNDNITRQKEAMIQLEMCSIVARQLKDNLSIDVSEDEYYLLNGWENIFSNMPENEKNEKLDKLRNLLLRIWNQNKKIKFYDSKALLDAISSKWRWSKYNESWHETKKISDIREALDLSGGGKIKNRMFKFFIKKPLSMVQRIKLHTDGKVIEHMSNVAKDVAADTYFKIDKQVEHWTWERYQQLESRVDQLQKQNQLLSNMLVSIQYKDNIVPYKTGEKIRIVFLFQIASFWPSWESFYNACKKDGRLDVRLVFLDETNTEKSQMATAYEFLESTGLEYVRYDEFDVDDFRPHAIVIQTPYDKWHRKEVHWSNIYKMKGYRLIYIPYGIEISDTNDSHILHFEQNVIYNCWRIYTFSDAMLRDYKAYCTNSKAVRALGLPRFDYYSSVNRDEIRKTFGNKIGDRKIVLWKVHFPKIIYENGKKCMVTPEIDEYAKFSEMIGRYTNLFFIFMPHPKFFEQKLNADNNKGVERILYNLSLCENAYIDMSDDYRKSLSVADYVIVDRSAIMVEAAAINRPVLYMSNKDYYEPVTSAIKPLIDSYYQGNSCDDMVKFLDNCQSGLDTNSSARELAFAKCFPMHDGMAGERIKEDVVNSIIKNED